MKLHRILNWVLAAVIAAMLSYGQIFDRHRLDLADSTNMTNAQRLSRPENDRDIAAAKLCRELRGEAGFTWSAAGELVCIPRRGRPHAETVSIATEAK